MTTAYLSLGSNLGNRVANLRACIKQLAALGRVTKTSSFYETQPVELANQPWFVNCVVELTTEATAHQLLAGIQEIEADLGRSRTVPKGPRTIDIDIVLFGSLVTSESSLQIPHPAMHTRRFVLVPLVEIASDVIHSILLKTARELLLALGEDEAAVKRLAE